MMIDMRPVLDLAARQNAELTRRVTANVNQLLASQELATGLATAAAVRRAMPNFPPNFIEQLGRMPEVAALTERILKGDALTAAYADTSRRLQASLVQLGSTLGADIMRAASLNLAALQPQIASAISQLVEDTDKALEDTGGMQDAELIEIREDLSTFQSPSSNVDRTRDDAPNFVLEQCARWRFRVPRTAQPGGRGAARDDRLRVVPT